MISRIIFMGTPAYASPFLEGLVEAGMKPIAVITQQDKPVGRKAVIEPTPVKVVAQRHGIPVMQPEKIRDEEWMKKILELEPDIVVVVAFGQIIPKSILDIPQHGCINVHPSLLPRHRGASPLQEAILQGDNKSGVTIMLMDEKMDHGPLLSQETVPLDTNETYESLRAKTISVGVPLLITTLRDWMAGKIRAKEQCHEDATFSRLLTRDSGKLDWSHTCLTLERMVRALNPWPGTWTTVNGKRLKILSVTLENDRSPANHLNELMIDDALQPPTLKAICADRALRLDRVQLEGGKEMSGTDFIRGHRHLLK